MNMMRVYDFNELFLCDHLQTQNAARALPMTRRGSMISRAQTWKSNVYSTTSAHALGSNLNILTKKKVVMGQRKVKFSRIKIQISTKRPEGSKYPSSQTEVCYFPFAPVSFYQGPYLSFLVGISTSCISRDMIGSVFDFTAEPCLQPAPDAPPEYHRLPSRAAKDVSIRAISHTCAL
jgi:hypothetical protein